jgi:hypothetical protein
MGFVQGRRIGVGVVFFAAIPKARPFEASHCGAVSKQLDRIVAISKQLRPSSISLRLFLNRLARDSGQFDDVTYLSHISGRWPRSGSMVAARHP